MTEIIVRTLTSLKYFCEDAPEYYVIGAGSLLGVAIKHDVFPIEVKARENVKSRSLSVYVKHYHPEYSIRISGKNFGLENNILSIPLYAVFCL